MSDFGRLVNCKDGTPRGQIYQGDATSHGGVVIRASGHQMKADGLVNARLGDLTFCPKCLPHIFSIATADPTVLDYDIPVPRHGDLTTCGAFLLAQAAPLGDMVVAEAFAKADSQTYNEQFQLLGSSEIPLAGMAFQIEWGDGLEFFGYTDAEGKCPRLGTQHPEKIRVWFGAAALLRKFGKES